MRGFSIVESNGEIDEAAAPLEGSGARRRTDLRSASLDLDAGLPDHFFPGRQVFANLSCKLLRGVAHRTIGPQEAGH